MLKYAGTELLTNQFILMLSAVFFGLILGKFSVGRFKLGASGTLFTGMFIGWYTHYNIVTKYTADNIPLAYRAALERGMVDDGFFYFFLIIFVASVGLLAAKDIGTVIKKYGAKFAILGAVITFSGALACYLSMFILPGLSPYAVAGVYTGALTSSPGLGAALETVSAVGPAAQEAVAAGHAAGYPFGVIILILSIHLLPRIFSIDVVSEKEKLTLEKKKEMPTDTEQTMSGGNEFDLAAFTLTCLVGYIVGQVEIFFGPLGYIGLGSTGGVLITALFLGHIGNIGPFSFRMNTAILTAFRQLALVFFLSIVGLKYGYAAVETILIEGLLIVIVSVFSAAAAILSGFILGHYIFKINWIILAGAICGGMTSTPGLGAAIDITDSNDVASGYGAAYPVALFFMVLFTILLHSLPIPY